MRFVLGRISVVPGKRAEFLAAAADYVDASRRDRGCTYYQMGSAPDDPDAVVLVEAWESAAAHSEHTTSAHFAAFGPIAQRYFATARFDEVDSDTINTVALDFRDNT
jgi:quinol monooxygenase YgiN